MSLPEFPTGASPSREDAINQTCIGRTAELWKLSGALASYELVLV